jgi:hypothetical protein
MFGYVALYVSQVLQSGNAVPPALIDEHGRTHHYKQGAELSSAELQHRRHLNDVGWPRRRVLTMAQWSQKLGVPLVSDAMKTLQIQ